MSYINFKRKTGIGKEKFHFNQQFYIKNMYDVGCLFHILRSYFKVIMYDMKQPKNENKIL